jgi:hypothetical protein
MSGTQPSKRGRACVNKLTWPDAVRKSYVTSEKGTLGCVASSNRYGSRLNRATRVNSVLVTLNRSVTLSRRFYHRNRKRQNYRC